MEDDDPILASLNAAQKAAVTSPSSVLQILAPPGSGKTKTLTSRVAYFLRYYNYSPWNIICVTFTIKSAREMKERIAKLIGPGVEGKLILGTFHSVCRRYLVSYGYKIGVKKGFGIADSADSLAMIQRIVKRLRLNIEPKVARARVSAAKSKSKGVEQLTAEFAKNKKQNVDQQEFITVFEEYEAHLAMSNLLDYDDLLLRCADLLERHPECVSNVEAVLIDEFQDTNNVQYRLMNMFAIKNKRITTVGDPDQSIYGWRSAEILNLSRMRTLYPDTLVINLEINYRSTGAILSVSLKVIEQDESRPEKSLKPTHCRGTVPTLRKLPSSDVEAAWIVTEIGRSMALTGTSLLKYSDYAILLRSAALSRQIESALGKAGIPYRMVGGLRFFDRIEVKILLDYMRVVSQPDNSDALSRILNTPNRGVGDTTIKALMEEARSRGMSLFSLIKESVQGNLKPTTKITKNMDQGLGNLFNLLLTCRKKLLDTSHSLPPQHLLDIIWKRLQFKEYLERKYPEDHGNRWSNVEELIVQAEDCDFMESDFEELREDALPEIEGVKQDGSSKSEEALTKFLANVALATEVQKDDDIADETGQLVERVTVSTIHAAKGLEWPVVFIPSAYDGSIPHSRAEDNDEERRLLYVAMTRAQALLYISCPMRNSGHEETTVSPFLTTKEVSARLAQQGPCLITDVAVPNIARILGRECPTQQTLNEGLGRLQRIEDDFWPLDGSQDAETVAEAGLSRTHSYDDNYRYARKRRKIEDTSLGSDRQIQRGFATTHTTYSSSNITMQNTASFTVKSSTSGFMSAASHYSVELARVDDNNRSEAKASGNPSTKSKAGKSRVQETLVSLWKSKGSDLVHEGSKLKQESYKGNMLSNPNGSHLEEVDDVALPPLKPHSYLSRAPMSAIRDSLESHKLPNTAAISRPKVHVEDDGGQSKAYVFLSSSSPVRPQRSEQGDDKAEIRPLLDMHMLNDDKNISRGKGFNEYGNRMRQGHGGRSHLSVTATAATVQTTSMDMLPKTQAASTLHRTSIAQLQARDTNAPRKTLGMRRSMIGWQAKRPFQIPHMGNEK